MEKELDFFAQEEEIYKCRKHPSPSPCKITGVCPSCLRDRLLLLCPDCTNLRPCACYHQPSSSSSSSSFSSSERVRYSVSGSIGSVGRVSNLIEIEPAFQRSRSVATCFVRQKSEKCKEVKKTKGFWGLLKKKEMDEIGKIGRSRSIHGGGDERSRFKMWNWNFMSPIRVFKQKKIPAI